MSVAGKSLKYSSNFLACTRLLFYEDGARRHLEERGKVPDRVRAKNSALAPLPSFLQTQSRRMKGGIFLF